MSKLNKNLAYEPKCAQVKFARNPSRKPEIFAKLRNCVSERTIISNSSLFLGRSDSWESIEDQSDTLQASKTVGQKGNSYTRRSSGSSLHSDTAMSSGREREGLVQNRNKDADNMNRKNSELSVSVSMASVRLEQSLNVLHYTAMLVAATGNSAIFINSSVVIEQTGSLGGALIVWLLGGLLNLAAALCYVELGVAHPKAIGHYSFFMMTFGDMSGFMLLWGQVVLVAAPLWSLLSLSTASYIIKPVFPDCSMDVVELATNILAGWILITMVAINFVSMKCVTKVQTSLTFVKLLALCIIIASGAYTISVDEAADNIRNPFQGTSPEISKHALAVLYTGFFYGGWQAMSAMVQEMKDPKKDLPRACYISFAVIILLYLLTNVAFSTVLTLPEMSGSSAVASLFMERVHPSLVPMVSSLIALATLGSLNSMITSQTRLLLAGAKNGHAPQFLGKIGIRYLSPWPALVFYSAITIALLYSGGVTAMMSLYATAAAIAGVGVPLALLCRRWKYPEETRPYKTLTFIPWLAFVTNVAILILGLYQDPYNVGIGLAIFLALIPVYWLTVCWKNKPQQFVNFIDTITVFVQKLFLAA